MGTVKTRELEDARGEIKVLRNSNARKEMSGKVVDRKIVQNKLQNLRSETKELRDMILSQREDMMDMISNSVGTLRNSVRTNTSASTKSNKIRVLVRIRPPRVMKDNVPLMSITPIGGNQGIEVRKWKNNEQPFEIQ